MPTAPNQSVTQLTRNDINLLDLLSNSDPRPIEAAVKLAKNPKDIFVQLRGLRTHFNVKTNMALTSRAIEAGIIGKNGNRANATNMLATLLMSNDNLSDPGVINIINCLNN